MYSFWLCVYGSRSRGSRQEAHWTMSTKCELANSSAVVARLSLVQNFAHVIIVIQAHVAPI